MLKTEAKPLYILYLEDDPESVPVNFLDVQKVLNVQIISASTFEAAQKLMESRHFDLFILDIEIVNERTTGIQLAEEIRQSSSYVTTPILFTSMHTHYSHWLFSKVRNCSFLPKPFSQADLIAEIGIALGVPQYIKNHYSTPPLILPNTNETYLEINPLKVSYMEITNRTLFIQYIDGQRIQSNCSSGIFKKIMEQIALLRIDFLRQIYRSILVNVNQIKKIQLEKNVANIYLFNEDHPLPLGMRYRENIQEFL